MKNFLTQNLLLFRLKGRWFAIGNRWFPALLICRFFGHGEEFWYDGPICMRCGDRIDDETPNWP